jgi:RNA recognition motif-containing protein
MTSIFVAKLDFGITSEQLKQAFQEYGTVLKATVATDRETGKSRGFGFVEMADREEAMNAIKSLDGSFMNGRPIAVKEAEQRTDSRPPRDNNSPRPDFNRNREGGPGQQRPSTYQRPEGRPADTRRSDDDEPTAFVPPIIEPLKGEPRKVNKEKDKKAKDWDTEGRTKKPKLNPYKKSGKNNRFFGDDDDDDDWDIHAMDDKVDDDYEDEIYDEEDEDNIED